MVMKHSISALACALTLGLATGGYAQKTAQNTVPRASTLKHLSFNVDGSPLKTPVQTNGAASTVAKKSSISFLPQLTPLEQALQLAAAPSAMPVTSGAWKTGAAANGGPQRRAITDTDYYECIANSYVFTGSGLNDVLDDVYLPAGIASKGTGVTLTGFEFLVISRGAAAENVFGQITFYDQINTANAANVAMTPLQTYNFSMATPLAPNTIGDLPLAPAAGSTPFVMTHDLGSTGNARYGVRIAFYTDATYTTINPDMRVVFTEYDRPQTGESFDVAWNDPAKNGLFPAANSFYFGGGPHYTNLFLILSGTSNNDVTYSALGSVTLQGLTTNTPAPVGDVHAYVHNHADCGAQGIYL